MTAPPRVVRPVLRINGIGPSGVSRSTSSGIQQTLLQSRRASSSAVRQLRYEPCRFLRPLRRPLSTRRTRRASRRSRPSAKLAAVTACSAVEIPTPRRTGLSVVDLRRRPISAAWRGRVGRAHRSRRAETRRTRNPRDRSQMSRRRSSGWSWGAASNTVSTPAASAASPHPSSSSSGRSGTMAPSIRASASWAAKPLQARRARQGL